MKILVNALSARSGGGQTYLRHLLEKFPEDNGNEIDILAPDTLVVPVGRSNIRQIKLAECLVNNPFARTLWEMLVLPKLLCRLGTDVLFCPGGSVSGDVPAGCKVVTTFQNMMPFDMVQRCKYPFGYMRLRNWMLERKLLKSMLRSDWVIFISNYAKFVIEKRAGIEIKKSVVIPHGINPHFRRSSGNILSCPHWLPNKGYLLYVSPLDVYKAQVEVVEAYALLKRRRTTIQKLVLVGSEFPPYGMKVRKTIKANNLEADVIIKEAIPNCELPAVYQNATVNIFASETENCPFILLEALAAGRPLLVSDRPPMPEFGEDAVVYFDPSVPTDLADKLAMVLDNTILMRELSEKALKQSFRYDWDTAARLTWGSIENIAPKKIATV